MWRGLVLGHSLERKEPAAAHNRCVNLFVPIPALQAAVGLKNSDKQFVSSGISPKCPVCANSNMVTFRLNPPKRGQVHRVRVLVPPGANRPRHGLIVCRARDRLRMRDV